MHFRAFFTQYRLLLEALSLARLYKITTFFTPAASCFHFLHHKVEEYGKNQLKNISKVVHYI